VADIDERVAWMEGKLEEQTMRIDDVRGAVRSLEEQMNRRFDQLEQRFTAIDQRFTLVDQRFALVDQRFVGIDGRLDKMTNLHVALLIAVIAGLGGVIAAILKSQ
jgi:hypothetical protein